MTLFVPRPRAQTGLWQRAKTIFEPLHWTVWLMLILAPLGMSLVQQFLLNVIADDDQPVWSYVQAAWERRISWSTAITEASREVVKTFGPTILQRKSSRLSSCFRPNISGAELLKTFVRPLVFRAPRSRRQHDSVIGLVTFFSPGYPVRHLP